MNVLARYTRWLHTMWPAGTVDKLPEVRDDGTTAIPGVRITGDLTGIPLLKFSSDSGARAVRAILAEPDFRGGERSASGVLDLAIVGGGVSGVAAAIEAKKAGLDYRVYEAAEPFATVVNFPKGKPIYTYPVGMTPSGGLQFRSEVHPKEQLLADLERERREAGVEVTSARIERIERAGDRLVLHHAGGERTEARRAIVAIGKSGAHRRLGVPGEDLDKVFDRLHDPKDFAGRKVLVVGGGDSAVETAVALAAAGAAVTLSYRKKSFGRPKAESLEQLRSLERRGAVRLALGTQVVRIEPEHVALKDDAGKETRLDNDVVFTMLGREAPLDFFRRSGIPIRGEWKVTTALAFAAFVLFCVFLYNWKSNGAVNQYFQKHGLFPYNVRPLSTDPSTLAGDAVDLAAGPRLLLLLRLLHGRARLRHPPHPAPKDSVRPAADDRSHGHPVDPALPAAVIWFCRGSATTAISTRGSVSRSPTTSSRSPTPRSTAASTGAPSASSWPGRSSSGTSSPGSR